MNSSFSYSFTSFLNFSSTVQNGQQKLPFSTPWHTRQAPIQEKVFKIDTNSPKFHGNLNEDKDDWLYKIRINLDIASIPELRYLEFITNYCISKAGIFLRRLRESHENKDEVLTWAKFKTAMITRYRPVDNSRRIRNQLMTLKLNITIMLKLFKIFSIKLTQMNYLKRRNYIISLKVFRKKPNFR